MPWSLTTTKKAELFEWAKDNCKLLAEHSLYATGTTGYLLESMLGLNDPLEPQPHDADVKALLRIAVVWNIPVACNRASADFIISSPLMSAVYQRKVPDYSKYRARLAVRGLEADESASLDDMPAPRWSRQWRPNPNPKIFIFVAAVWKQIFTSLE